jgi:hypothetical protein
MEPALDTNDGVYTVLRLPDELLGLSQSFLGDGEFRFIAPVCKRFNSTYLDRVSDKKITTVERATSSISRARGYLEYAGEDAEQHARFWFCAARYGRVGVMEWAHQRGYSRFWNTHPSYGERRINVDACKSAAENGQLGALQWLRQNGCPWNIFTCSAASRGGHLSVLQ